MSMLCSGTGEQDGGSKFSASLETLQQIWYLIL